MIKTKKFGLVFALLATTLGCSTASAATVTVDFYQGGYSEGAYISGSLSGELPAQQYLRTEDLTSFEMSFSGNSIVSAFTFGLSDLGILEDIYYVHSTPALRMKFNDGSLSNFSFTSEGTLNCGGNVACAIVSESVSNGGAYDVTYELGTFSSSVSAVPVPAAVWLFGSGLIGLIGLARRKTA